MSTVHNPRPEEVDELLRNAQLRDQLEPFVDESIERLNLAALPTPMENDYLASMLAWEKAPVLPIGRWFEPELTLPPADMLSDAELRRQLWKVIHQLYSQRIVLDHTDHLSDRALYRIIRHDILPAEEKKIEGKTSYLHWDCSAADDDPHDWLRYYASDEERRNWAAEATRPLPPREIPPFPRQLPREPA
jgi:hypothetical protein